MRYIATEFMNSGLENKDKLEKLTIYEMNDLVFEFKGSHRSMIAR